MSDMQASYRFSCLEMFKLFKAQTSGTFHIKSGHVELSSVCGLKTMKHKTGSCRPFWNNMSNLKRFHFMKTTELLAFKFILDYI